MAKEIKKKTVDKDKFKAKLKDVAIKLEKPTKKVEKPALAAIVIDGNQRTKSQLTGETGVAHVGRFLSRHI